MNTYGHTRQAQPQAWLQCRVKSQEPEAFPLRLFIDMNQEGAHLQVDKRITAAALGQDVLTSYNKGTYTFYPNKH